LATALLSNCPDLIQLLCEAHVNVRLTN